MEEPFYLRLYMIFSFFISGGQEKEDAADLVSSPSSNEETVTLPCGTATLSVVEVEILSYSGKLLVQ